MTRHPFYICLMHVDCIALSNLLDKAIHGGFQVCLLALGAAAWSGKTLSFFKHIPAGHATKREHHELSFLCYCRTIDVWKVFVDLPFPNADGLGDFSGGHLLLIQEQEHPLADGLRMTLVAHGTLWGKSLPACGSVNAWCFYSLTVASNRQYM